jgi:prepilin-type N-terminal cleavage/methylation domain-containing protein
MVRRDRCGFTIVELLVVIAIIAMLMALLVPAVLMGMARARQAQCLSNMKQVGQALYHEATVKTHFPGRVSFMKDATGDNLVDARGEEGVTWVAQILPNLEAQVLQDYMRELGSMHLADTSRMYLPILVCPSDVPPSTDVPALSYVVNARHRLDQGRPHEYDLAH